MSNSKVTLYDWVPFMHELGERLSAMSEGPHRDQTLRARLEDAFGADSTIVQYPEVDPVSFMYYLAQKNTSKKGPEVYRAVRNAFGLQSPIPTDWTFPTPSGNSISLFHDGKNFYTDLLWELFGIARRGDPIPHQVFDSVLAIKGVGLVKLTQALFIINPTAYLPYDDRLKHLRKQIPEQEPSSASAYQSYLDSVRGMFADCEPYEVNLFAYLTYSGKLRIGNRYYLVGTNVYNGTTEQDDYRSEFFEQNHVRVGGERSGGKGKKLYPLTEPNRGDIVLAHFGPVGVGIGVVLHNEYQEAGGFDESKTLSISVLWINKRQTPNVLQSKQSPGFVRAHQHRDRFAEHYPDTFDLLKRLRERGGDMDKFLADKVKNLVLQGPPGSGKTRRAKQLAHYLTQDGASLQRYLRNELDHSGDPLFGDTDAERVVDGFYVELVQFHPAYSYEDFVRGISAEVVDGNVTYQVTDRTFMQMVRRAHEEPDEAFVLIIDEMNRANLPAVFGELIYALEYRGEPIRVMYGASDDTAESQQAIVPTNLYVIGTMNTADRSIGHIDYALRRRFVFLDVPSNIDVLTDDQARSLYERVRQLVEKFCAADFEKTDIMPGHSYFLTSGTELRDRLEIEVKPLLREYVRDGVLMGQDVVEAIESLALES